MKPFGTNGKFSVPADSIRRLAVQGAGATVLSGSAGVAIQIVATMALARMLAPRDFGLVAMVTTFSLLLTNFGVNGFTEAVLQREEVDHALASNLFWISFGAGVLLTLGFAAMGPLLAWFYHDPVVERVTLGVSLTIVLTSTSVLHLALLNRAMRFPATSANDIVARVASVAVSISLGLAGWGCWALVAGAVAQPLTQAIGAWYMCRWVPGLPRKVPGTASMVRFALHVYARFSVNYFARNMDNLLVGWRFGAHSLGFYKKAYDLFALPAGLSTAPLTNVAVSALSRFKRVSDEYKENIISALGVLAFLGMALGADLTLVGKDLIRLLLGPGWEASGRIFTFFGPGIGVMLVYYAHGWIHLSIGRADRWFRWGIIEFASTGFLFFLALPWGPEGIAVAWTASFWILTIPAFWYAGRPIGLGVSPVLAAIWKYLLASLLAEGASSVIVRELPSIVTMSGASGALTRVVMISMVFGTLYLATVILLHQGRVPLLQVVDLLSEMLPRGTFQGQFPNGVPADTPMMLSRYARDSGQTTYSTVRQGAHSEPLVSILIPAYNSQAWIADTLRSALAQTWERKEIIVVDDGSSDQTLAIARKFEWGGVRVITQKNQGAAAARNKAFSLCHGDYIQWLDADDLLAPDKIARQMEAAKRYQSTRVLLSSPWGKFLYRHYRAEFVPTSLWCDLSPLEWLLRKMGQNVYIQTAAWLVSRELTEAAGPWDTRLLSDDDGEYFCRVLLASEGVRFVPEAKTYYRGPGLAFRSLSHVGQSARKIDALWLSMQLHIGYLRSLENSERVRTACLNYLQSSLIYFYPEKAEIVKQAQQMARELGGQLRPPCLSWKYSWMKMVFGWSLAKRGRDIALKSRVAFEKFWDKALLRIEGKRAYPQCEPVAGSPQPVDGCLAAEDEMTAQRTG